MTTTTTTTGLEAVSKETYTANLHRKSIKKSDVPKFIHRCPNCQFLGRYQQADLYVCLSNDKVQAFVARTGHNDGTYISGLSIKDKRLKKARDMYENRRID